MHAARVALIVGIVVLGSGACGHDDAISPEVGASCATHADCAERCLGLTDPGDYPGGFCTVSCVSDNDCPNGAICMERGGGACLFPCDGPVACGSLGPGWRCELKDSFGGGERAVCIGD